MLFQIVATLLPLLLQMPRQVSDIVSYMVVDNRYTALAFTQACTHTVLARINARTCAHTHARAHGHVQLCALARARARAYTQMHARILSHLRACVHTDADACAHTQTHTRSCVHANICALTHPHTRACAYMQMHARILSHRRACVHTDADACAHTQTPVSYTHLTLPTNIAV